MNTPMHLKDTKLSFCELSLREKIEQCMARVAVIGLGYVGLPLAVEKAKVGFDVIGIDQNRRRVDMVNNGENYIRDVNDGELCELVETHRLRASVSYDVLAEADVVIICVPTPLTKNHEPDISYIVNVTNEVAKYLRCEQLVVLESTTYPGTTQEVILPRLEATGLKVGKDFFLAHSPERVDPGNQRYTTKNTSKVVGGMTPACLQIARSFYEQTITNVVPVASPAIAEMTKVFENTYRAVNIALVNELMLLCNKMGVDVWEVVEAAGTKPFGIQSFYPGPGVGGHCIPIDPFYLAWKAREFDFHTRFIELAGEINIEVSYYVVDKVIQTLNSRQKAINGSRVLILGMAYKKDIPDVRESPAFRIISQLVAKGAQVCYHDPLVHRIEGKECAQFSGSSVPLTAEELNRADCVLIITDHSGIDYGWVVREAQAVVDTRNVTRQVKEYREKICKI